jgi:hypothetical protein
MIRTAPLDLFTQAVIIPVVLDGMEAIATPPPTTTAADTAPAANVATPRRLNETRPGTTTS